MNPGIFNRRVTIHTFLICLCLGLPLHAQVMESNKAKTDLSAETSPDFKISLAQWSLYRSFFGEITDWNWYGRMLAESPDSLLRGKLDPLDFPDIAKSYGIDCIELISSFYLGKVDDKDYFAAFKKKCEDADVKVGLIMCDLGNLGHSDPDTRQEVIDGYFKWVDLAKFLGAHSVRVSLYGFNSEQLLAKNLIAGLSDLGEYAALQEINVLVENDGGPSSDAAWLAEVVEKVGLENVGTLPDFGNFCLERDPHYNCIKEYDKYKGIQELMPYAKAVSAKSYAFDENGNETSIDFYKMMKIVKDSGYRGYIAIEYEGYGLSEDEGIRATKLLLEKTINKLDEE